MSAYMGIIDYQDLLNMQDEYIMESLEQQEVEELLACDVEWPTAEEHYFQTVGDR